MFGRYIPVGPESVLEGGEILATLWRQRPPSSMGHYVLFFVFCVSWPNTIVVRNATGCARFAMATHPGLSLTLSLKLKKKDNN